MLPLWEKRTQSTKLLASGKLPGEHLDTSSTRCSPPVLSARPLESIPALSGAIRSKAAYTLGTVNNQTLHLLLDSGASCSVIHKDHVLPQQMKPPIPMKLVNADGSGVVPMGSANMRINLGDTEISQDFVVVDKLSAPAILGCNFLKKYNILIDFGHGTFSSRQYPNLQGQLLFRQVHLCTLVLDNEYPQAIPYKTDTTKSELDMPTDYHSSLESTLKQHSSIFQKRLGQTNITKHVIDTGNSPPIKVPPRPIPFHYVDRVQAQLQEMANEGIIQPSNSLWCALAVYVPQEQW